MDAESIPCDGWWAQLGLGRQPMDGLRLTITEHRIVGSGVDVVGAFTFDGSRGADGSVRLTKQYLGAHAVGYRGHFDGRQRLAGTWALFGAHGPWEITLRRPLETSAVVRAERQREAAAPPPAPASRPKRRRTPAPVR